MLNSQGCKAVINGLSAGFFSSPPHFMSECLSAFAKYLQITEHGMSGTHLFLHVLTNTYNLHFMTSVRML